ncbi:MAG TPA: ribonuclease III [Pseudogracilibacillus sp.]|nr:ribonuclease III [Pseudogracilibacillus sp.]
MDVANLMRTLNLPYTNKALLQQAFTHSSYVNEHHRSHLKDNERLEFLGDAVLELAVSDFLFKKYPQMSEGNLSKLRANIVREESLSHFAKMLYLHEYVLLGKGEERTGGRTRQSLLADVFEAFLGAVYLDQGMDVCIQFLEKHIFPHVADDAFSHTMDYKTKLQELVQRKKNNALRYDIIDERGPSHRKQFVALVAINETLQATGKGYTKKEAEQQAARKMLAKLRHLESER